MSKMSKFEKKFGKYAISNLPLYIIIGYVIGYILSFAGSSSVTGISVLNFLTLDPYAIMHGEIWRLFTWILVPPSGFGIFTIIMLYFYYSIGRALERVWGTYRFNVYIFAGMFFTIVGSFFLYFLFQSGLLGSMDGTANELIGAYIGSRFSTYYINMSIILAFAATFPNNEILLMMIFPIKMKWLGILYGGLQVYEILTGNVVTRVVIIASLLNFLIFFIQSRRRGAVSLKHRKRQSEFRRQTRSTPTSGPKHKCAVCGRTELDDPSLVFRYCSKCDGDYEYCQDHLFTHEHVKK